MDEIERHPIRLYSGMAPEEADLTNAQEGSVSVVIAAKMKIR